MSAKVGQWDLEKFVLFFWLFFFQIVARQWNTGKVIIGEEGRVMREGERARGRGRERGTRDKRERTGGVLHQVRDVEMSKK